MTNDQQRFDEHLDLRAPSQLFHYTDQSGLLGIIKSGQLWATKIQYMNDTTELALAISLAKDHLTERIEKLNNESAELLKYIR